MLRRRSHGSALANRRQDEERDHQDQPQDDQEDDESDVIVDPGRDLLLKLRRAHSGAGSPLVVAEVEAGSAFAGEQRDQPQVLVVPADPERSRDDVPVLHG